MNVANRIVLAAAAGLSMGALAPVAYAHGGNASLIHACVARDGDINIVGPNAACQPRRTAVHWSTTGPAGPAGSAGAIGGPGPAGADGPQGSAGADGSQGPAGADGSQGPAGADGTPGLAGADGAVGPQGPTGPAGADGTTGPQGPAGLAGADGTPGPAFPITCPMDSVLVGTTCIDTYEASVWETTDAALIAKIKDGTVTPGDLTDMAAAVQHGVASDDYGAGCPNTGNGCVDFYAVSIPGVTPSAFLTWFQAAAAARNAGKRILTNAEWQAAALGTPDAEECNSASAGAVPTGSRASCVSDVGAYDMVGNLEELTADWVPQHGAPCLSEMFAGTGDINCYLPEKADAEITSLQRGGSFKDGMGAGVFAVHAGIVLQDIGPDVGFRAAR